MRKPNLNPNRLCWARLLFNLTKEGRRAPFFLSRVSAARTFFLLCLLFFSLPSHAQTLRIAAAADLQYVLPDLAAQYEKQSGAKLAITYGSSGNFFAQIQNGAPFDLFLSADKDFPDRLIAAGLADKESLAIYAYGSLVLWLPPDSPLDPAAAGLKTLLDPRIQKIAIANPEHAPYGLAAVIALQNAGLYDQLKPKLVLGENISQAAQFVQSGSAQAGLIALSLAISPPMKNGKRWVLTSDRFPLTEQAAVVLNSSPNRKTAIAFITFLRTPAARATFERYGFSPAHVAAAPRQKP
jgi:molybdate transport system substrate-binding protein